MKHLFILLVVLLSFAAAAQSGNDRAIRRLLQQQTEAWNRGDLEGFMQTYWKSDSLMFVGRNGVVWGWQRTRDNYKKGYNDKTAMGTLSFDIIQVKKLWCRPCSKIGYERCPLGHFKCMRKIETATVANAVRRFL